MFLNSGRYLDTGSSSRNFPSSNKIITAVLVIALDCEAMLEAAQHDRDALLAL
jgi:hypothetical protein